MKLIYNSIFTKDNIKTVHLRFKLPYTLTYILGIGDGIKIQDNLIYISDQEPNLFTRSHHKNLQCRLNILYLRIRVIWASDSNGIRAMHEIPYKFKILIVDISSRKPPYTYINLIKFTIYSIFSYNLFTLRLYKSFNIILKALIMLRLINIIHWWSD